MANTPVTAPTANLVLTSLAPGIDLSLWLFTTVTAELILTSGKQHNNVHLYWPDKLVDPAIVHSYDEDPPISQYPVNADDPIVRKY
jgi:hypothetical protein